MSCIFPKIIWEAYPRYTCEVISTDFSDNSTHMTSQNGTHPNGLMAENVTMVSWAQSDLTIIPKGFSDIFPGVYGFQYENCSIESLNGDELGEYSLLFWWSLTSSNLQRIPGNFFATSKPLIYISFKDNRISEVGDGLLDELSNLSGGF